MILEIDLVGLDPRLQRVAEEVGRLELQVPRLLHLHHALAHLVHEVAQMIRLARRAAA